MANELENSTETKEQTAEQPKVEETADVKALRAEIAKLKQSVTSASADASKHKHEKEELQKQLKERMSAEERAEAERAERDAARDRELEELRAKTNIADYKAQFIALGYDSELAQESAEALNSGDTAGVFGAIRKFIDIHDRALAEKAVLNNPTLPGGNTVHVATKEEFMAMDIAEMTAFKNEHPSLFTEYTK